MKKVSWKQAKPGDVLGIYIGNESYAFMRLMFLIPGHTWLCEVFNYTSRNLAFSEDILRAPRLMPILNANWYSYLHSKKYWRAEVVHRDDSYCVPVDEIREVRLVMFGAVTSFNMDWTPESGQMRLFSESVKDRAKHAELSKKYASQDLFTNPVELVVEIRNRLGLVPELSPHSSVRDKMWQWLEANGVYTEPQQNQQKKENQPAALEESIKPFKMVYDDDSASLLLPVELE